MENTTMCRVTGTLGVLLTVLLVAGAGLAAVAASEVQPLSAESTGQAKNVILLIGDGMGYSNIQPALVQNGSLAMLGLAYKGNISTSSANSAVTDSAAAATALMTGFKTNNGMIGMTPDYGWRTTIAELAEANGRATGLVSTKSITDATPAGVFAHVSSRSDTTTIANQFVASNLDVALGGGSSNSILVGAADEYTYVTSAAQLMGISPSSTTALLGLFAGGNLAYDSIRPAAEPSIAEMTDKALSVLSTDPDGFFLMVEGGNIDTAGHSSDRTNVNGEIIAFDRAVQTAIAFASRYPDTLLIVTADHMTWGGHLSEDVPVMASGPGAERLNAITEPNTYVFEVMRDAIAIAPEPPVAAFTASPTSGRAALEVQFTSTSTGTIDSLTWDFGDGSAGSTAPNPTHSYATVGTYTATLTVTNSAGTSSTTRTISVMENQPPVLGAIGARTVNAGEQLRFTVTATDPDSDPLTLSARDVPSWATFDSATGTFLGVPGTADAGTTSVTFTVSDGELSDAEEVAITVQVPLDARFTANTTSGKAPLAVQFTDTSAGGRHVCRWDFGDRTSSAAQNPIHTYTKAGTYTVRLTVTDGQGATDTVTQAKFITVPKLARR